MTAGDAAGVTVVLVDGVDSLLIITPPFSSGLSSDFLLSAASGNRYCNRICSFTIYLLKLEEIKLQLK